MTSPIHRILVSQNHFQVKRTTECKENLVNFFERYKPDCLSWRVRSKALNSNQFLDKTFLIDQFKVILNGAEMQIKIQRENTVEFELSLVPSEWDRSAVIDSDATYERFSIEAHGNFFNLEAKLNKIDDSSYESFDERSFEEESYKSMS